MGHTDADPKLVSWDESDANMSPSAMRSVVSPWGRGRLLTLACAWIIASAKYDSPYIRSLLSGLLGSGVQCIVYGEKWNERAFSDAHTDLTMSVMRRWKRLGIGNVWASASDLNETPSTGR